MRNIEYLHGKCLCGEMVGMAVAHTVVQWQCDGEGVIFYLVGLLLLLLLFGWEHIMKMPPVHFPTTGIFGEYSS